MAKRITQKNGKKETYFKNFEIGGNSSCPECNRPFKPNDLKFLEINGSIRCPKCNSKLTR